jgi:hypothetical protein
LSFFGSSLIYFSLPVSKALSPMSKASGVFPSADVSPLVTFKAFHVNHREHKPQGPGLRV